MLDGLGEIGPSDAANAAGGGQPKVPGRVFDDAGDHVARQTGGALPVQLPAVSEAGQAGALSTQPESALLVFLHREHWVGIWLAGHFERREFTLLFTQHAAVLRCQPMPAGGRGYERRYRRWR